MLLVGGLSSYKLTGTSRFMVEDLTHSTVLVSRGLEAEDC